MERWNATATGDAATALSDVFFKTHRETSGWLSMFVNFNSVILFHAVAFLRNDLKCSYIRASLDNLAMFFGTPI